MEWNPDDYVDPVRFTQPLDPLPDGLPRHSDGYKLIQLVEKHWTTETGDRLRLDTWQARLLIRILETDAEGNLRFRQVLLSIGRQNGKSVLGAVLALYGLIHLKKGANVVGLATSVEQANLIYGRVRHSINNSKALGGLFTATGTRGIRSTKTAATYVCKPAKSDALQGIPVNLALLDEGHLLDQQLYDDIVNGQRAQDVALLVLITTAGDDNSLLLKRLYADADGHIQFPAKVGVFIYEGVEGAAVDDAHSILRANPAIACGRVDLETVLSDVKSQPAHSVTRYLHNLFVSSSNPFVTVEQWLACAGTGITEDKNIVFGFDVAPKWKYATVTAARKRDDGVIETEVVATFNNPTLEDLQSLADQIKRPGCSYVMDSRSLRDLMTYLKDKGREVHDLNGGGYLRATSMAYSLIVEGRVSHNRDAVLSIQVPYAQTKNVSDGFRLVAGSTEIDAVCSTMWSIYIAATKREKVAQLF